MMTVQNGKDSRTHNFMNFLVFGQPMKALSRNVASDLPDLVLFISVFLFFLNLKSRVFDFIYTDILAGCPCGAYHPIQIVEVLIDRIDWAKFTTMLDLTPLDPIWQCSLQWK